MFFDKKTCRRGLGLALIIILCSAAARASDTTENAAPNFSRFSLSLAGGVGISDRHQGLLDLKTELQFGLSPRVRIGLGVGYIGGDNSGFDRGRRFLPGLMMSHGSGEDQDIRVVPLSVNVYYILPLGRHWSIFASGGGSYYLAELHGLASKSNQGFFGVQGGAGVEYHLSRGVSLVAEGSYRVMDFRRLSRLRPDDTPPPGGLGDFSSFLSQSPHHSGINLRGVSFRLGFKINL